MKKRGALLIMFAIFAFAVATFFAFYPLDITHHDDEVRHNGNTQSVLLGDVQEPVYLFVHTAGPGALDQLSEDEYMLTVSDPDDEVIYFSDRPYREVGREKLGVFLDTLGFEVGKAPNATIVIEDENGERSIIVAELTEPIWNRDENYLTYTVEVLRDAEDNLARYGNDLTKDKSAQTMFFIDSSHEKHDDKKTWKNDENEKCHGLKLKEAVDIAEGVDSECDLYRSSLNKDDYKCSDDIKGWTFGLNTNIKGEASKCDARCIVMSSESYKDGEGVARVEYTCHHSSDEKGKKNIYCPEVDYKKDHHYKDVQEKLINKYHHILDKVRDHKTSYEHHYCVTTGMPYGSGHHWATDCSGLGGFALFDELPYHYKLLDNARDSHARADRPLATDFYDFIHDLDGDDAGKCWERIHKLEHAEQGDFLIVKYNDDAKTSSTGHVMWIDEVHNETMGHRKITVIDSANSGHGSDTRNDKGTYNCDGDKDCGIGRGDMWFYTNDDGEPIRYTWKAHPDQDKKYCKKHDKECDCDHDKCELEGIVIGRVKDCKSK